MLLLPFVISDFWKRKKRRSQVDDKNIIGGAMGP
jgi:hypothetical protein